MQRLLSGLGALILLLLMLLGTADVVGRYFLSSPIRGASELTELLMAALVFSLFPVVTAQREHITVELFGTSPRLATIKAVLGYAVVAACLVLLVYCVHRQAKRVAMMGDVTDLLRIPKGPIFYFMAGSALLALVLLIWSVLRRKRSQVGEGVS
jgi:TRAP-type C4-dicarboxylate transport system permease small subunit